MGRSSYAKRLTGQASHNMPVLKAPVSPFQKWTAPKLAASPLETAAAPSLSQTPPRKAQQSAAITADSNQMGPAAVLHPASSFPNNHPLTPPPVPHSPHKVETK